MEIDRKRLDDDEYRTEVITALMHTYSAAVMRFCTRRLGEGLAEEVAQEVFVTAWEKLPTFRPDAPLEAWLFGIARYKCQQAFRNRARRHAIDHTFMADIHQRVHAEGPATPDHRLLRVTEVRRLHDSLRQLREVDRMVVMLRYWQDLSVADIAEFMGKSEAAVRKRLTRVQQHLKELMHETMDK